MYTAQLLFFLITGTFFLQCRSQDKQIRGTPEVDYPTYYVIPKTSFRCSDQLYNPGFYADTETRCQVFHYCYEHRQDSFLCPMGTIFNQPLLACDYWYSSNCSLAPSYYHVNAIKRNEDFFDEGDEPQDSQSENLFDKMAHLYEINKTPESVVLKKDSDAPENELSRDGIVSSTEPLIEKNNKTEDYNKYNYDDQFNMVDEKHPEIVKYEVLGSNALKVHKDSENEQLYETYNVKDFILSEDGMLHSSQDDIYQLYPTDMNFDQAYSGYAEIPREENVNDNLNGDYESDFQMPGSELQKRFSNINGDYIRRPLSRKPIIIVPEAEPEIVQLPVVKHKRKPTAIPSTVSMNANGVSSYETTYDSNIHNEDTVSFANEDFEGTTSSKFPLDEPNSNLNYAINDPKVFYENLEQVSDENGSNLHQTGKSSIIHDYSNKKNIRYAYVLSNNDEDENSSVFEPARNDISSISNAEQWNTLIDSNYGDESEFIKNSESSIVLPGENSDTAVEGSFDSDPFLGSGSENIIQSHSSAKSGFPEDQNIFSDSEDIETTDSEISYVLPMNISDNFEGSGISVQKTADMPNFVEEVNEPIEFLSNDYSEDSNEYNGESSFSLGTFGKFSPSEDNEGIELVPDGSGGGSSKFNFLPHELQESSDNPRDTSGKMVPEIQEIDGSYYYVFPNSEYHSNSEYEDSSELYSENEDYAVTENFESSSVKSLVEFIDNVGSRYVPIGSKLKTDNTEKLSDEIQTETAPVIPEEYIIDDSDSRGQLSTEDLKFLEIISQTPVSMPKNLIDASNKKSSSDAEKAEMPSIEITSLEQDIDDQTGTYEDADSIEDVHELETVSSTTSPDLEHSAVMESSEINSGISEAEQKIAEDDSPTDGSSQEGLQMFLRDQNLEKLVLGKETDPFNPLFAESGEILGRPDSRQKSSLKVNPAETKSTLTSPVTEKDLKKVARGKRFNENLRIFNPSSKANPLITPSRETFREAVFSNIPTTFLKMKHSTLRPYFYNYNLKNSGFNPRTGDLFESSKLTFFGKRLLAAKRSKFNAIKKYIDSYRNN